MEYFKGFQPLGNEMFFYEPAQPTSAGRDRSPSLVILATWFSAIPRHVSKYIETYKAIFPDAAILIIPTSTPEMVYLSYSAQQNNLAPTLPILSVHAQQPGREILFHILSNAGAHTACQLAHAYRSHTGTALTVGALILDSAPGIGTYRGITNGFIAGLPSTPILRDLLSLGVHGIVGLKTLKEMVTGEEDFVQKLRKDLNDDRLFRSEKGRIYIYSKDDKITQSDFVELHASEAEEKGIGEVKVYLWENSGHIGHMTKDSERYWNIVKKLWDDESKIAPRL